MSHQPVSVSRHIAASPATIFDLLADPAPASRRSMARGCCSPTGADRRRSRSGTTSRSSMKMAKVPYRVTSKVTELEPDARIAWQPWTRVAGGG